RASSNVIPIWFSLGRAPKSSSGVCKARATRKSPLRVAASARPLHKHGGRRVVTTYLGAHSRPAEFPDLDSYIENVCSEILPRIHAAGVADRVDIYVENGFFTPAHARKYLTKAREFGFGITAHVEQLSSSGGIDAVLEFSPQSLDHVVYADEKQMAKLAHSETTAVLLPTSD